MPLDNTLNVSELLRRLGVKGDSLGSAPLLESLRLNLAVGDLSDLLPPVAVPFGAASLIATSGVATVNKWSLVCRSPGGLMVRRLSTLIARNYNIFITPANVMGAATATAVHNFSFGQIADSFFANHAAAAAVTPANAFRLELANSPIRFDFDNWVGPGEFFNIEAVAPNVTETITISWKEYPAALNPG